MPYPITFMGLLFCTTVALIALRLEGKAQAAPKAAAEDDKTRP